MVPAASPSERPSRFLSKGLQAVGLRDKKDMNPLITNRETMSPPQTTILSYFPLLMNMAAVFRATTPEMQAMDITSTRLGLPKYWPMTSPNRQSNTRSFSKSCCFLFSSKSILPLVVERIMPVFSDCMLMLVCPRASVIERINIFSSRVNEAFLLSFENRAFNSAVSTMEAGKGSG